MYDTSKIRAKIKECNAIGPVQKFEVEVDLFCDFRILAKGGLLRPMIFYYIRARGGLLRPQRNKKLTLANAGP